MQTQTASTMARLLTGASRLTRSGKLMEATAAIQRALGMPPVAGIDQRAQPPAPGMVLDGLVTERREAPARAHTESRGEACANFASHHIDAPTGVRQYKLFSPSAAVAGSPRPLVVMLHGCTQDPDDFAAGTRMNELAERAGWFVLYPAQAQRSNFSKCWNWFNPGDQRHGDGEPALLAAMTREVVARNPIDPHMIYIAGLSAGGAMAAIMGREYPDLFAAVGIHSGLPQGAANDVASAFSTMQSGDRPRSAKGPARAVPTIVFHGDRDGTVHPAHGRHIIEDALAQQAGGAAPTVSVETGPGGRRVTRSVYSNPQGRAQAEHWELHGGGHAWSGGSAAGSFTDPAGPDASAQMLRFFGEHRGGNAHP
ncbi:MAG: PHB depolymerase family esterase [Burkholderiaceae bacterium]